MRVREKTCRTHANGTRSTRGRPSPYDPARHVTAAAVVVVVVVAVVAVVVVVVVVVRRERGGVR